jgi:hypothetical protein
MSFLQNSYLQEQIQRVITIYNNQIVHGLTKKNKVIAISTAVCISIAYLIRDIILKPPRQLRHIPYIGYFSVFKSLIKGESFWDRVYRVKLPKLGSPDNKGIYLVNIFFLIFDP